MPKLPYSNCQTFARIDLNKVAARARVKLQANNFRSAPIPDRCQFISQSSATAGAESLRYGITVKKEKSHTLLVAHK